MFGPLFDGSVAVAGLPPWFAVLLVGALGGLTGLYLIHRIVRADPEPESFWATARPGWRLNVSLLLGLVLALVAVVLINLGAEAGTR